MQGRRHGTERVRRQQQPILPRRAVGRDGDLGGKGAAGAAARRGEAEERPVADDRLQRKLGVAHGLAGALMETHPQRHVRAVMHAQRAAQNEHSVRRVRRHQLRVRLQAWDLHRAQAAVQGQSGRCLPAAARARHGQRLGEVREDPLVQGHPRRTSRLHAGLQALLEGREETKDQRLLAEVHDPVLGALVPLCGPRGRRRWLRVCVVCWPPQAGDEERQEPRDFPDRRGRDAQQQRPVAADEDLAFWNAVLGNGLLHSRGKIEALHERLPAPVARVQQFDLKLSLVHVDCQDLGLAYKVHIDAIPHQAGVEAQDWHDGIREHDLDERRVQADVRDQLLAADARGRLLGRLERLAEHRVLGHVLNQVRHGDGPVFPRGVEHRLHRPQRRRVRLRRR
mmetsp:Transcript_88873/g.272200  ORF Transcript_88873/g.272200 Transcript_88873/m.272200 type:complete len:395 (-) Transcript_88873:17-1201(-)